MIEKEVRHIIVPRSDVDFLSLERELDDNLRILRETGHSRYPLCEFGLDSIVGSRAGPSRPRSEHATEPGPLALLRL